MEEDDRANAEITLPLFNKKRRAVNRLKSHARDELQNFRTSLRWLALDQSSVYSIAVSWIVFLILAILVPFLSVFFQSCHTCDREHGRPYNKVVQISESVVSAIAFISLSNFVRKYGLRRFLFLDQLCDESSRVSVSYTSELNSAFKLLSCFLLPCLALELALKVWWYATSPAQFAFIKQKFAAHTTMCITEIISRGYRAAVFFLVCVLFRLACSLQILRFQDFIKSFSSFEGGSAEVISILKDHMRISHQLRVISHRFRGFIVTELICITFSQFVNLFVTTAPKSHINLFTALDLALCSVVLLTGAVIVLHSAARITHKAQGVASVASRWNALATCNADDSDDEDQIVPLPPNHENLNVPSSKSDGINRSSDNRNSMNTSEAFHFSASSDIKCDCNEENVLNLVGVCQSQISSFAKRQAVVKYLEHNTTGITVFGFVLDRTSLQMIFGIELSFLFFILGKTISISA